MLQYSNQSLDYSKGRFSGQGDCDDFSILLASLIESIGGTSRIILAYGPDSGHAYTEVYLGKAGGPESDVGRMVTWLRKSYKVEEINTHTDLKTGDVWLNLDWWKDPNTRRELSRHPGGPFFKATSQVPVPVREDVPFQPPMPVNEPPEVLFTISPEVPVAGQNTVFDATQSKDIGGRIESYLWDFGDGNKTDETSDPLASHIYEKGGPCTVILTAEDDEGAVNISSKNVTINNPPQANFTITPQHPVVGDLVKFDASKSDDAEDGKDLAYHWEINNNSAVFSVVSPPRQPFDEMGMYWINLTVTDKNGAKDYKNLLLKINQLPIPHIAFGDPNFDLGEMITFIAESSEDPDGEIVSYVWDFGDNSPADYNKRAMHTYHDGGNKTVKLLVTDNDGAISDVSQEIFINTPPVAKFSINPEQPKKGELVSFDASASSDPDGNIKRYMWDFGVGKAEPEIYYSEFAEHTYSRLQKYHVSLTVEDDESATNSTSQVVEIKDINTKATLNSLNADKQSPQEIGAEVIWTAIATDTDNDPLEFQFRLDGNVIQDWSASTSWSWTADKAGTHVIDAKVRDGKHDPNGDSSRSAAFEIVLLPNNLPILTSLSSDKERPQATGTLMTWTAVATDAESDPLEFQFALDGNAAQDWSASPTWSWNADQAGMHTIEVKARDADHPEGTGAQGASFEIVLPPNQAPILSSLLPDMESPQETGTTVAWTASAEDTENDPLEFQFWLDGNAVQDWSASPSWSWTADQAGAHTIEAKVRDGQHDPNGDSSKSAAFEIVLPPNTAPILTALSPDKESPQASGTLVTWTAVATDAENDPLEFQFWLDGNVVRDWYFSPTWSWAADQLGAHTFEVKVRDGQHNPNGGSSRSAAFEITPPGNSAPILNAVTPDKKSPQNAGTVVTWTAKATDANKDPILYRFWLKGPATGNAWKVVQDWSPKNLWTWASTDYDVGSYSIYVYVRDGKHAPYTGYDSAESRVFVLQGESLIPAQSRLLSLENAHRTDPYNESIESEIAAVQAVIDRNIDESFKTFA